MGSVSLSFPAIARASSALGAGDHNMGSRHGADTFVDLRRQPDVVIVQTANGDRRLTPSSEDHWDGTDQIAVTTADVKTALRVSLSSPSVAVIRLRLRWRGALSGTQLILGDAWERGYGDLEWRGIVPDRVMPWYFATYDGQRTDGYGVRTGANALCFWYLDPEGVTLCADVRSGGVGVELGQRTLDVCDVIARKGQEGESAFVALHAFCKKMCAAPRLPAEPVYGSNDWYWAYGNNSTATVLADAHRIVELSPTGTNRPFTVIDDGWQPGRGRDKSGAGTWDRGNEKFPDMPKLVTDVRAAGARAGVWIRPLQAPENVPVGWRLKREGAHDVLDPTLPDVQAKISADVSRVCSWGFDLIKHDYTTFDIFGRWGFQMGSALTRDGWTFASGPTRTTAEVLAGLYRTIRAAAGDALVIGCNTVSHLSAGIFEISRVGDDTSGTDWARTRKMGVNSLAFRGTQHGAFYAVDADCVGVTNAIPWAYNRQWLDLLARSGTTLFVSLAPDAVGAEQRRDLRAALALASRPQPLGEPIDWQRTTWPEHWRLTGEPRQYHWIGDEGPSAPQ